MKKILIIERNDLFTNMTICNLEVTATSVHHIRLLLGKVFRNETS